MKKILVTFLCLYSLSYAGWIVGEGNGKSEGSAYIKAITSDWSNVGNFGI
ncbi:MAG: hypothetical protein JXQ66_05820 [Campylobacterales bacterium]|nr:hypothetical protein [Campylobacterales bacterium]